MTWIISFSSPGIWKSVFEIYLAFPLPISGQIRAIVGVISHTFFALGVLMCHMYTIALKESCDQFCPKMVSVFIKWQNLEAVLK